MKCRRCDQANDPGRTRCTWCDSRLGRRGRGLGIAVVAAVVLVVLLLTVGCAARPFDTDGPSGSTVQRGLTCRTDPAGWLLFVSDHYTVEQQWTHVRSVTYCVYPDDTGYPPAFAVPVQYVTWNGQSHVWTKDSPANTHIIVRRTPPSSSSPGPRRTDASPRTSNRA